MTYNSSSSSSSSNSYSSTSTNHVKSSSSIDHATWQDIMMACALFVNATSMSAGICGQTRHMP
jgi:hypothetical protein